MLDIKIADNVRITSDDKNYILQTRSFLKKDWLDKKKGELTNWTDYGYYQNWSHLLEDALHLKIRHSNIKKIEEVIETINLFKTAKIK